MHMSNYLQAGAGLLVVLGLIALAAVIARKLGLGAGGLRRDDRRLSIVETMQLDPKRRVLLIKCDFTEHLVLLGPNSETVLSGRPPERSTTLPLPNPQIEETREMRSSPLASGPSKTTNAAMPSDWATRKSAPQPSPRSGRREPQIGPLPRDPK